MQIKLGERKVQEAKGSALLNLPRVWVESFGIKKGDRLYVEATEDGSLKILRGGKKMESEPFFLKDLEEGIGLLETVREQGGFVLAEFQTFSLLLPPDLAPRLKEMVGGRVAILKIDGSYRVRVADGTSKFDPQLKDLQGKRIRGLNMDFNKNIMEVIT